MAGGKAGGGPAAVSAAGGGGAFTGLTGVDAPLTGIGTPGSPLAIPPASNANDGYMTASHVLALEGLQAGQGLGWVPRATAKAVERAGFVDDQQIQVITYGAGFNAGASAYLDWYEVSIAGGQADYPVLGGDRGGQTRFRRSVSTGTVHYQRNAGSLFEGGSSMGRRWYMRARIKIETMAGSGASAIVAFGASNNGAHSVFIDVGVINANSTTKYSARIVGTTTTNLISTVSFNTTDSRWIECWSNGAGTFLSVEDESPIIGSYVAFTSSLKPNVAYISDGTAGQRGFVLDRAIWASDQAQ